MTKFDAKIHTKRYLNKLEKERGSKKAVAIKFGITPKTYGIWYKKAIDGYKKSKEVTPKKPFIHDTKIITSVDGFLNELKKRKDHIYYDYFMNSIVRMKKKPDRAKYEKFIIVLRDLGYQIVKE